MLLVTGNASSSGDERTNQLAYDTARKQGWPARVLVGRHEGFGDWSWGVDGDVRTLQSKDDIGATMGGFEGRGPILVNLIDHGGSPATNTPLKAKIDIYGPNLRAASEATDAYNALIRRANAMPFGAERDAFIESEIEPARIRLNRIRSSASENDSMTHQELLTALRALPGDRPIRLIGGYCYDGALHSIAFEMPNVCAASATGYRNLYRVHIYDEPSEFGAGFWNEMGRDPEKKQFDVDGDRRTSTFEAFLAAMRNDFRNGGLGQLSSEAFVDRHFQINSYSRTVVVEDRDSAILRGLRKDFPTLVGNIQRSDPLFDVPRCEFRPTRTGEKCFEDLGEFFNRLDAAMAPQADSFDAAKLGLPAALQSLWRCTLEDWNRERGDHAKQVEQLKDDFFALKKEWDDLSSAERRRRNDEYVEKFDALHERSQQQLHKARYQFRVIRMLEKMSLFMQTADDAAKAKLVSLLQCEMESL